jgi:hypothetical protein
MKPPFGEDPADGLNNSRSTLLTGKFSFGVHRLARSFLKGKYILTKGEESSQFPQGGKG